MNKKDIKHNQVFAVPLLKNQGYIIVKLFMTSEINKALHTDIFIRTYDLFFENLSLIDDTILDKVATAKEYCFPNILMGFRTLRGKDKWILLGEQINETENFIPLFRTESPRLRSDTGIDENTLFSVVKNIDVSKPVIQLPYSKVKFLPNFSHSHSSFIQAKLTMLFMIKNDIDVYEFFTKEEFKNNFWLRMSYNFAKDDNKRFTFIE